MTPDQSTTDGVGKSIGRVDDEAPDDTEVANALGFSVAAGASAGTSTEPTVSVSDTACGSESGLASDSVTDILETLVGQYQDLVSRVSDLEHENERLRESLAEKESDMQQQQKTLKNLASANNDLRATVKEVDERTAETREIAKSTVAKVSQLESKADPDKQEDAENLPHGVEPSTSPLDFFANCRQRKVKKVFVERQQKPNTYRAVRVAKWWDEFATTRSDGSGVFFDRDDIEQCLTALLNKNPHPQTVSRVWNKIVDLGGEDVVEKTHQVSNKQEKKEILAMDMETAEGLLDQRYIGLDLIEDPGHKATSGGVTPVVMRG